MIKKVGDQHDKHIHIVELYCQGRGLKWIAKNMHYNYGAVREIMMNLRREYKAKNTPHLIAILFRKGILK